MYPVLAMIVGIVVAFLAIRYEGVAADQAYAVAAVWTVLVVLVLAALRDRPSEKSQRI